MPLSKSQVQILSCVNFVSEKIKKCGYKKDAEGRVYSPVFLEGSRGDLHTRFWKLVPECTIEKLISSLVDIKEQEHYAVMLLNVSAIAKSLRHSDTLFPIIERNRHAWSFMNGVFLSFPEKQFVLYGESRLSNITTSKLFQLEFNPEWISTEYENLKTPFFDTIFAPQEYTQEMMDMVYGLTGRLTFDVGEIDNFQVLVYLRGESGTGKSRILFVYLN